MQNNAARPSQFKIQTSPPAKAMEPARSIVNLSRDFELSVSEVIGYLKEYGGNALPTLPPLQPKGGDVFLLVLEDTKKSKYGSFT